MNFSRLKNWISNSISVKPRLINVCVWYLLYLMVATRKHTLRGAAGFSGINKSQFSRFLKLHHGLAVYTMEDLSKKHAKQLSKSIGCLAKASVPWKIAIIIDSTIQGRSSLHAENSKRFNHGKGFVIGHQWTNIVLIVNDMLIPLKPIAFYSRKYCRQNALVYKTENESVVEYLKNLNLKDYVGEFNPKEVIVLADSGYDDQKIENAIAARKWQFIIALKKSRSVKSEKANSDTSKSKGWCHIGVFFKNHRWIKWQTIRIVTDGPKRKRMDFRIRQIIGYLRYVGRVQLICSEFKKRPQGRRKYLACNDLKAQARQILIGYRLRWAIEIFHKQVKMFIGFQDVATKSFKAVVAHVHWVYSAYILLHSHPPGLHQQISSLVDKQIIIKNIIDNKEKSRVIQLLTQINGAQRYKTELQQALKAA